MYIICTMHLNKSYTHISCHMIFTMCIYLKKTSCKYAYCSFPNPFFQATPRLRLDLCMHSRLPFSADQVMSWCWKLCVRVIGTPKKHLESSLISGKMKTPYIDLEYLVNFCVWKPCFKHGREPALFEPTFCSMGKMPMEQSDFCGTNV